MIPNNFEADAETLLAIYRKVTLLHQNDEQIRKAARTGKIQISYYSYRGQEIIPAALAVSLRDEDKLCTIYRGIHDALAKGFPLRELWAEISGKQEGSCKGKGGPMHLTHPATGVMVTTGIVGSSAPIANGLAWAAQLDGRDNVAVATFGDGASNIGAVHEAMNMASVWKLPVIFLCQNNRYAEHTAFGAGTSVERIADRAAAYGMPGIHVDGNDPKAMYAAAAEAVARARAGEGPTLIEAMTFRFFGHNLGDDDSYIPKDEKEAAIAADPVPRFRAQLIADGIATEDELSAIEAEAQAQIMDAFDFAQNGTPPDPAIELTRDVYAEELPA